MSRSAVRVAGMLAFAVVLFSGVAFASINSSNGQLDDFWGVSAPTGTNGNDWTPAPGILWISEDSVGSSGYVGPGYGGQDFDIEAMFASLSTDGTSFYLDLAIVTGFDQAGEDGMESGAVFLDFGNNDVWDAAIRTVGDDEGGVYTGSGTWWTDPYYSIYNSSSPYDVDLSEATQVGTADFEYVNDAWSNGDHNVYEMSMNVDAWISTIILEGFTAHYTIECGNDLLELTYDYNPDDPWEPRDPPVPEPATFMLLGLGIGAGMLRRKFSA